MVHINPNEDQSLHKQLTPLINQRFQELGLSESQIKNYDTHQLERSIQRLDQLVKQPEEFNLGFPQELPISFPEEKGQSRIVKPAVIKPYIGSAIVDRKQVIFDNLFEKESEKVKKIATDSEKVEDAEQNINEIVQTFKDQVKSLLDNEKDIINAKFALEKKTEALNNQLKTLEKKSQIKLAFIELFLARESGASILGSVAFISIFVLLIYSIFHPIKIPDIINNTFLIILGYFFGQSSINHNRNAEKQGID